MGGDRYYGNKFWLNVFLGVSVLMIAIVTVQMACLIEIPEHLHDHKHKHGHSHGHGDKHHH